MTPGISSGDSDHDAGSIVDVLKRQISFLPERRDDRVDGTRRDGDDDGVKDNTASLYDLAPESPVEGIFRIQRRLGHQDNVILTLAVSVLASHVAIYVDEPEGAGRKSIASGIGAVFSLDNSHSDGLVEQT